MGDKREICIMLNYLEAGVLLAILIDHPEAHHLKKVIDQLVDIKRQVEKNVGVVKKKLPDGRLYITDSQGNIIIRPSYPWEREEDIL